MCLAAAPGPRAVKVLYFDCFSGAAGDMILAALLDAGAPEEEVRGRLDGLGLDHWRLEIDTVDKGGLRARRATVVVDEDQTGRAYRDVKELIGTAGLPASIEERALGVFLVLAKAESRVHDVPVDDVHFHEAGALDAILDVVGCCTALEHFMPARVVTSAIATGTGTIESEHGTLPLPAPAVTEIFAGRNAQLFARGKRELVTPTGAAILADVTDEFAELPPMRIRATGYGAGARDDDVPNVLRVLVGEESTGVRGTAVLIETNIDDMSPELVPDLVDSLIEAGAQDAWTSPTVMKKGRPAFMLSVLVGPEDPERFIDLIYKETSTLGLRLTTVGKDELASEWVDAEVAGSKVRVKLGWRNGEIVTTSPEHDDALEVARATGLSLERVYELALADALRQRG